MTLAYSRRRRRRKIKHWLDVIVGSIWLAVAILLILFCFDITLR
jgi:hypothetical protein